MLPDHDTARLLAARRRTEQERTLRHLGHQRDAEAHPPMPTPRVQARPG